MDELSEDARKLIDTAMGKDDAPPPDASWGAFVEHMTSTQARSEEVLIAKQPEPTRRWWPALVGVVAIAGLASWWLARDRGEPDAVATPSKAPADRRAVEDKPASARPRANAVHEPTEAPSAERLLPDAEAALKAGAPERALTLLEQHAERAPLVSADQRMALRIQVLCALGREDDARAEGRAFLDTHAKSEFADDVRRSCVGK